MDSSDPALVGDLEPRAIAPSARQTSASGVTTAEWDDYLPSEIAGGAQNITPIRTGCSHALECKARFDDEAPRTT
jgi:hypothetical protein